VPYPAESAALSGVQKHCDYMLYRRTVDVPRTFTDGGQHLRLNFGAVNYDATVYMNATELARTPALQRIQRRHHQCPPIQAPQEIVVAVHASEDSATIPVGK